MVFICYCPKMRSCPENGSSQWRTGRIQIKALTSLPSANEVCEGYVFTPVCQSFCSQVGGGVPRPRPERCKGPGRGGEGCVCVSQHALRQTAPPPPLQQTATAADGMDAFLLPFCYQFVFVFLLFRGLYGKI